MLISTSESMRILEEVYEMPGCPEETEKKCEIWREGKHLKWLKLKLHMGQSSAAVGVD
jgi:hypothetical protein